LVVVVVVVVVGFRGVWQHGTCGNARMQLRLAQLCGCSAALRPPLLNTRDAHTAPALLLLLLLLRSPPPSPPPVPVPPQPQSTDHHPPRPSAQAPRRRSTAPSASPFSTSVTCPAIRFACGGQAACCDLPGTGEWCGDDQRGTLCEVWSMHASSSIHLAHAACFCLCSVEGCPIPAHAGSATVQQPPYSPPRTPSLSTVHSCAHPGSFAVASAAPSPLPPRCLVSPGWTPQPHSPSPSTRDDVPSDD
jgi:hypothetical protein